MIIERTYEVSEVHETEDDNMSITRSTSVAQTDNRVLKKGALMLINCPREDNYDYAPLFKRTYEASKIHEIQDNNMPITRSISVVQTDNRVLKANCHVDYSFY